MGTYGDIAVAAAALRGHKHRVLGIPGQDSFYIAAGDVKNGSLFVVVAVGDGVGSAPHSAHGSRRTTQLFATRLARRLDGQRISAAVISELAAAELSRVVEDVAKWGEDDFGAPSLSMTEVTPNELETTLTFAVLPAVPEADGTRRAVVGFVGDSPAFVLRSSNWTKLRPTHDDDDVMSPGTQAVFSNPVPTVVEHVLVDGDAILLTTDGVGNYVTLGESTLALGHRLARQWVRPLDMLSFLRDVDFDLPGADDDRTAVMCWVGRTQFEPPS
jgi:serine/threonine protein phosphatase PrpC